MSPAIAPAVTDDLLDRLDRILTEMSPAPIRAQAYAGDPGDPVEYALVDGEGLGRFMSGDGFLLREADARGLAMLRNHGAQLVAEIRRLRAVIVTNAALDRSSVGAPARAVERMRMHCLAIVRRAERYGYAPSVVMASIETIQYEGVLDRIEKNKSEGLEPGFDLTEEVFQHALGECDCSSADACHEKLRALRNQRKNVINEQEGS